MENHHIVAIFEIKPVILTLSVDPPGSGYLQGSGTYNCGHVVTLNTTGTECYEFVE